MQLTKGALGMLIRRYSNVLKKCHMLNLLGGFVLAGAVACPANAAINWETNPVIVNSTETVMESHAANNLNVGGAGTLNVNIPSSADDPQYLLIQEKIELNNGVLNVNNGLGIQGRIPNQAGTVGNNPYPAIFNMNGGTLNVNGSEIRLGAIAINGGNISISGGMYSDNPDNWINNSKLVATNSGKFDITGATITLGNYSFLAGGKNTIKNSTINMAGDSAQAAAMLRAMWSTNNYINIEDSDISVDSGKHGIISAANINISGNSNINLAGDLVLAGGLPAQGQGTVDADLQNLARAGKTTVTEGGAIDIAETGQLTLNKGMRMTLGEGASLNNAGNIVVNDSAYLHLLAGDFSAEAGSRLLATRISASGETLDQGVIRVTDTQLAEALKGGIELQGGALLITGAAQIAGTGFFANEAADGKIAITAPNATFSADTLTVTGSEISLPMDSYLTGHVLNLDQNVTAKTLITVRNHDDNKVTGLNVGDGNGTLTLESHLFITTVRNTDNNDIQQTDINGNVVANRGSIVIENTANSQGLYANAAVNIKENITVTNGSMTNRGTQLTLASGTAEQSNTISLVSSRFENSHVGGNNSFHIDHPNTAFMADAQSSIYNDARIFATAAALGLEQKDNAWTSANIHTRINGPGRLNLTGIGEKISKESFKNLRDLLTTNTLKVDSDIEGAIVDGKTDLADVTPGGMLVGADLGNTIVTGVGNAGNDNMPVGYFGSVNLTNPDATGVTVTNGPAGSYTVLRLVGSQGSDNLVSTPNGVGNVIVDNGAGVRLSNGKIGDVEIKTGYATLSGAEAKTLHMGNNTDNFASIDIEDNVIADKLTISGAEITGTGAFETAGQLNVMENASLVVDGDIGDPTHLVNQITSVGNITANSIHAYNFNATYGSITVQDGIYAQNNFNISGVNVNSGADMVLNAPLINGSIITSGRDITINGAASLTNGQVKAQSGSISFNGSAAMSGESSINAGTGITLAGGLNVTDGKAEVSTTNGDINADGQDITVSGGAELRMAASKGVINANNIDATSIDAGSLQASGNLHINDGDLKLANSSEIKGAVTLEDVKADVGDMTIGEQLLVDSGEFSSSGAINLKSNAVISNGAKTDMNTLIMEADKTITVGTARDAAGGATLAVNTFMLNGGDLLVDPAWGQPSSNVAVSGFSNTNTAADTIVDGNVVVGQNSYVALGTNNLNWLPGVVSNSMGLPGLSENGPSAALGIFKPMTLGAGRSLTVDGTWQNGQNYHRNDGTITFADKSLLVVNGNPEGSSISYSGQSRPDNVVAALSAESGGQKVEANIAAGARLYITGAEADKNYVILDSATINPNFEDSTTAWAGVNLGSDNPLISIERTDASGEIRAARQSAAVIMPNLDSELVNVVDTAAEENRIGVTPAFTNAKSKGRRFLSRALAMASPLYGNDPDGAARTIEGAARMVVIGGAPQMTLSANNAAGAAITQRTSMANPGSSIQAVDSQGNVISNSLNGHGIALWVMPLYQSTNGFGMEAGNYDYDFSGALGGLALGADYTFNDALRAGILFNIGGGYMRGSGDFNSTTNSMNFSGVGAYAGWYNNNLGITADVNYTSTFNKIRQDLYGMGDMDELKLDASAWALSAALRAEYKINTDALDIIPHIGFRYTNLNVDSYDIESHGTVINGDSMSQNIWTFPIGISLAKDIAMANGWTIKPLLDLNVTSATGDVEAKNKIRFSDISTEAELKTKMMDYITYGGTAGIEFGNGNFSVGVNYNGQFGAESSAHGVLGTFRYEF